MMYMKQMRKFLWMMMAAALIGFTACDNADDPVDPGNGGGNGSGSLIPEGDGTEASPLNVTQALARKNNNSVAWVKGYIVGQVPGASLREAEFQQPFSNPVYTNDDGSTTIGDVGTNVLIADSPVEDNVSACLVVQLPAGAIRNQLNLVTNQGNDGKVVELQGTLQQYFGAFGLKSVTAAKLEGQTITDGPVNPGDPTGNGTEASPYNVAAAIGQNNSGVSAFVQGYIVGQVAGKALDTDSQFAPPFTPAEGSTVGTNILIADSQTETSPDKCLVVQLSPGEFRDALNLITVPDNYKKIVVLQGKLQKYFNSYGMKEVSLAKIDGKTIGTPVNPDNAIFSETFASSMGNFTQYSVLGDQVWEWRSAQYGVVMSGFANDRSNANEDWLISPVIDLAGKTGVTLSFDQAINKGEVKNVKSNHTLWMSNNYTSGDPSTATWTQVTITNYPPGNSWTFVSSGEIPVPAAFLTANMRFAFKYLCSDQESASWEIKNVVVK